MEDLIKVVIGMSIMAGFPLLLYAGFIGVRAFQRRVEGYPRGAGAAGDLEDLRARVAELEQIQSRVEELEERMDFSERILAQDKQQAQLKPE